MHALFVNNQLCTENLLPSNICNDLGRYIEGHNIFGTIGFNSTFNNFISHKVVSTVYNRYSELYKSSGWIQRI